MAGSHPGSVHVLGEHQPASDDVAGDVGHRPAGGEGVCAQPDERVLNGNVELSQDHSGGLVDLGAVVPQPVPPRPVPPRLL